jgi:Restriction endonuclease
VDWDQALAESETYIDYDDEAAGEDEDEGVIFLPPRILGQIAIEEVPIGAVIGAGSLHDGSLEVFWEGILVRNPDGAFTAVIRHDIVHKYWEEAVGSRFYLDLLHKCVLSMMDIIENLKVEDIDDTDDVVARIRYSFSTNGERLEDVFNKARRIQDEIETPAQRVVDDVTRALARSADRVLRGHYAQVSDLMARVEAAKSSTEKGMSLEVLMAALFEQVPGFVVYDRNTRTETEEIDLIVLNDSRDPVYLREGPLVLVECKNWTSRPGRPEFSLLEGKMRNRYSRCTMAFLVSWSGFSDTTWRETIRLSRDKNVIVCLTGSDIRRAALMGNFPEYLRQATLETLST